MLSCIVLPFCATCSDFQKIFTYDAAKVEILKVFLFVDNPLMNDSFLAWGDKMSILELGSVHLELGASYNIKTFL